MSRRSGGGSGIAPPVGNLTARITFGDPPPDGNADLPADYLAMPLTTAGSAGEAIVSLGMWFERAPDSAGTILVSIKHDTAGSPGSTFLTAKAKVIETLPLAPGAYLGLAIDAPAPIPAGDIWVSIQTTPTGTEPNVGTLAGNTRDYKSSADGAIWVPAALGAPGWIIAFYSRA